MPTITAGRPRNQMWWLLDITALEWALRAPVRGRAATPTRT
jgi:hypothetical protein